MGTNGDKRTPFARRHRGKLMALGALLALAAACWLVSDRYLLDMERYRRLAIETISQRTGLDAEFGRIHLDLGLSPRITVQDAVIRDVDATATVTQASAAFDLSGLFRRSIRIVILIDELDVQAPGTPSEVREVVDRVVTRWEETRTGEPSSIDVVLDRIQASDVRVFFDGREEAFAVLKARVDDVLSDTFSIAVDGTVPGAGEHAQLDGNVEFTLSPTDELASISGYIALESAALDRMPLKNAPSGAVEARLTFEPAEAAHGATLHASIDAPERPALTGELDADATWADETVQVRRVTWNSEGARIEGFGSYASADRWSASVEQARFGEEFLDALLAMAERPRARFEAETDAFVELKNFEAEPAGEGPVRLTSGEASFQGLAVVPTLDGTEMRAARGIHGSLRIADNVIHIEQFETKAARISGSLTPDFAEGSFDLELRGTANLAQLPWDALDVTELRRLEGDVSLARFTGTITNDGLADDFVLDGELRQGAIVYADDVVNIDVRNATGQFATSGRTLQTSLEATLEDEVPVLISGEYDMQDSRWRGRVDTDAARAVPAILSDEITVWAAPIAASVGAATADVEVEFPTRDRADTTVTVKRRGDAELNAEIEFANGAQLGVITAQGTFPAEALISGYFGSVTGTGSAGLAVRYDAPAKQIALTVDATDTAFETESIFRKKAGAGLVVEMSATTGRESALNSLEVRIDGVPAVATTAAPQNGVIPLEVDLPLVAPLLVEGASAGGTMLVRYDSNSTAAEFDFRDVSLKFAEHVNLERVHGPLYVFTRGVSSDGLEIRGPRADCTLRMSKVGDQWTGGLDGARLDLNAVTELVEAARTFLVTESDVEMGDTPEADSANAASQASYWDDPWIGEFAVSLDEVYYNRGRLSNVEFRILADQQAVRFRDVTLQPDAGQLTASIALVPDPVDDVALKLTVNATDLDATAINDLFWSENKDFFGTITGSLDFSGPLDDLETVLARGDGTVKWHGTNGSLGQTGFATKLLTALKTTDILNLRLRSLRDEGITYDTWDVDVRMTDGVAQIHDFFLDGGAYAMQGEGTLNFAALSTDARVYVRPLESVGSVLRRVPLIGNVAAAVSTDLLGVPVKFTGSPYDPEVSVAKELLKDLATTPIRAGQGAVKSVTGGSDNRDKRQGSSEDPEGVPPSRPEPPEETPSAPNVAHGSKGSTPSQEPSLW